MKDDLFDQRRKQMRLDVTKQNEEAARHTSWGKRGLWLKEIVNIQSNLEDHHQQQQHSRPLVMTHDCREQILISKGETMNALLAEGAITKSKSPTTKICLLETGFIRLKNIIAPYGPIPVSKSTWWLGVKSKRFPQKIARQKPNSVSISTATALYQRSLRTMSRHSPTARWQPILLSTRRKLGLTIDCPVPLFNHAF
jgi:hypothetical protein